MLRGNDLQELISLVFYCVYTRTAHNAALSETLDQNNQPPISATQSTLKAVGGGMHSKSLGDSCSCVTRSTDLNYFYLA